MITKGEVHEFRPKTNSARAASVDDAHNTDMGNALRFVADHGERVRYNYTRRRWHVWTGKHWRLDNDGETDRLARTTIVTLFKRAAETDDPGERQQLAKHALQSERTERLRAMLSLAQSDRSVATTQDDFDRDPWLLTVANGTLELRTGKLREHRPSDRITHCLDVEYDPKAKHPMWTRFLDQVLDHDQDLIAYLQRAVGYSLTGSTREQVFFLLYGTGANGKSTLIETVRSMLGPLAQAARFETFLQKRNESIPNDIARMRGARLVTSIEAEGGRRLCESTIKMLTGGDTVTARFMRCEFFDFKPEFKLWLATNHKPVVRGTDLAIWRRVKLIPFTVTIPEADQDLDLTTKLRVELPGILAWAVEGCREWTADGLGTCAAVEQHTRAYRDEQDVLGEFIGELCVLSINASVARSTLYEAYETWAKRNGDRPLPGRKLAECLRDRGIDEHKTHGIRVWLGLGLQLQENESGAEGAEGAPLLL